MLTRRLCILLFLFIGFVFNAYSETVETVDKKHHWFYSEKDNIATDVVIKTIEPSGNSLPERLEAVYETIKDYKSPDYSVPTKEGLKETCLGRVILNRCIVIFAALLILYLGLKILPVMYSPDKELDSMFWVKPVLIALVLATYSTSMGFVDKIMGYLSFKDYTSTNVSVVKVLSTTYEPAWYWRYNVSARVLDWIISNKKGEKAGFRSDMDSKIDMDTTTIGNIIDGTFGDWNATQTEYEKQAEVRALIQSGGKLDEEVVEKIQQEVYNMNNGFTKDKDRSRIIQAVHDILSWFMKIVTSLMRVIQISVLSVLFVGGPIAFVCEMVPGLEGSVKKWFGIYIRTHLLTPIIFLMDVVRFSLMQENMSNGAFLFFCFTVCMIVLYLKLEKISGYFISAEGSGVDSIAKGTTAVAVAGGAVAGAGALAVAGVGVKAVGGAVADAASSVIGRVKKNSSGPLGGQGSNAGVEGGGGLSGSVGKNQKSGNFGSGVRNDGSATSSSFGNGGVKVQSNAQSVVNPDVSASQRVSSIGSKVDPSSSGIKVRTNDSSGLLSESSENNLSQSHSSDNSGSVSKEQNIDNKLNKIFDHKYSVNSATDKTVGFGSRVARNVVVNAMNVIQNDSDLNIVGSVASGLKNPDKKPEDNQTQREKMELASMPVEEQKKMYYHLNPAAKNNEFEQKTSVMQKKNPGKVVYFNPKSNSFNTADKRNVEEYLKLFDKKLNDKGINPFAQDQQITGDKKDNINSADGKVNNDEKQV